MLAARLWEIVGDLPEQEKGVIIFRYKRELNTREIAQKMELQEKDVSVIHARAFRKLRKSNDIRRYYNDYINAAAYHHIGVAAYNTTWDSITERVALRL